MKRYFCHPEFTLFCAFPGCSYLFFLLQIAEYQPVVNLQSLPTIKINIPLHCIYNLAKMLNDLAGAIQEGIIDVPE